MKIVVKVLMTIIFTTIVCSYFGQVLLKIVEVASHNYKYLIYLLPVVLIMTKISNKKFLQSNIGMKTFISNSKFEIEEVSKKFPLVLISNTLFAHLLGASVGREGVAVQLGGAVGTNISKTMPKDVRNFFVRLGMICGFSALFQTPLAAIFFIMEITDYRLTRKKILEICIYLLGAEVSSKLSYLLGLEKFFVLINVESINFLQAIKITLGSLLAILIGMVFVIVQKKFKEYATNKVVIVILLCVFILISVLTDFKYSSLGTNLIASSFNNYANIEGGDFIVKLFVTALCTAIGFSGGEVTPLFAIGATFGTVYAGFVGLPIYLMAGLCYCLVFASSTKTVVAPMFLALEVFGIKLMLLIVIPSLLIYFINKKYSIYS